MVGRILTAADAAVFEASLDQLSRDIHEYLHDVPYQCYRINRDAGWEDGIGVEGAELVATGTGSLIPNGAGGPQASENVIHLESPYRFRTVADDDIQDGDLLVLDGTRRFRVDVCKRRGDDKYLMTVYLTELFVTPMPEVP